MFCFFVLQSQRIDHTVIIKLPGVPTSKVQDIRKRKLQSLTVWYESRWCANNLLSMVRFLMWPSFIVSLRHFALLTYAWSIRPYTYACLCTFPCTRALVFVREPSASFVECRSCSAVFASFRWRNRIHSGFVGRKCSVGRCRSWRRIGCFSLGASSCRRSIGAIKRYYRVIYATNEPW